MKNNTRNQNHRTGKEPVEGRTQKGLNQNLQKENHLQGNKNFLIQGSILAIAGILVRIIGIIYRIPLTRILGDEGIGYYSFAYDVYSIMLLISSLSIPLAVSKLVSARVIMKEYRNAARIFIGALIFALVVGSLVGLVTFFGAGAITRLAGYAPAAAALQVLAPTLVIMSVVGTLRGYFQGLGTMVPTAISQILEQIANAIVSVVAALVLFDMGSKADQTNGTNTAAYGYGAAGGTLGTCMGALTALLFMAFVFLMYKRIFSAQQRRDQSSHVMNYEEVAKLIGVTIVPVLISTTIYNFSNLIDSTIYGVLMKAMDVEGSVRSSTWGVYSGRYRLLTTVPIAVASSLASSIVPSLIASLAEGKRRMVISKIRSSVQFTMIVAIPCGIGLTALGEPILKLIFGNFSNIKMAVRLMSFSILTVITFSLSTITNSALQGIDRLKVPVKNASISLVIHLILLPFLLVVLKLDIYGVVLADSFFAAVVCYLNQRALRQYIGYQQEILKTFILPLVASLIMGAGSWGLFTLLSKIIPSNAVCTSLAIVFAVVVYGMLVLLLHIVDERTLLSAPKGATLVRIAKKFHLL